MMPLPYEYGGNPDETINCTANMNASTTVLSLIGKPLQTFDAYFFANRENLQTFVDSENKIGCYPTIRTVFGKLNYFLKNYNWIGCFANDTVSGLSLITEFVQVGVMQGIQ